MKKNTKFCSSLVTITMCKPKPYAWGRQHQICFRSYMTKCKWMYIHCPYSTFIKIVYHVSKYASAKHTYAKSYKNTHRCIMYDICRYRPPTCIYAQHTKRILTVLCRCHVGIIDTLSVEMSMLFILPFLSFMLLHYSQTSIDCSWPLITGDNYQEQ